MNVVKTLVVNTMPNRRTLMWAEKGREIDGHGYLLLDGTYPDDCVKSMHIDQLKREMQAGNTLLALVTDLPVIKAEDIEAFVEKNMPHAEPQTLREPKLPGQPAPQAPVAPKVPTKGSLDALKKHLDALKKTEAANMTLGKVEIPARADEIPADKDPEKNLYVKLAADEPTPEPKVLAFSKDDVPEAPAASLSLEDAIRGSQPAAAPAPAPVGADSPFLKAQQKAAVPPAPAEGPALARGRGRRKNVAQ